MPYLFRVIRRVQSLALSLRRTRYVSINKYFNFANAASPLLDFKLPNPTSSSYSSSLKESALDSLTFEKVCEETLESLSDYFEELIEAASELESGDVSYSSGVLTVNLGQKYGTYVINRQSPNKQIWLSSPTSGPKRYDFVTDGEYWIYKHDSQTLHQLLQREVSKILRQDVDFSKCSYAKI